MAGKIEPNFKTIKRLEYHDYLVKNGNKYYSIRLEIQNGALIGVRGWTYHTKNGKHAVIIYKSASKTVGKTAVGPAKIYRLLAEKVIGIHFGQRESVPMGSKPHGKLLAEMTC